MNEILRLYYKGRIEAKFVEITLYSAEIMCKNNLTNRVIKSLRFYVFIFSEL